MTDKAGRTAAHHAALYGKRESLEMLHKNDAKSMYASDKMSKTPLMYSIEGGHKDCSEWLVDKWMVDQSLDDQLLVDLARKCSVNAQDEVRVFCLAIFCTHNAHKYMCIQAAASYFQNVGGCLHGWYDACCMR